MKNITLALIIVIIILFLARFEISNIPYGNICFGDIVAEYVKWGIILTITGYAAYKLIQE